MNCYRFAWRVLGIWSAVAVLLGVSPAIAENIDSDNKYAYAENVGWLNAEPNGDGADGVQVTDFELTGWMWGENVGWVSLSCENRGVCSTVAYGVVNDGSGHLSGYAWAENVGWIDFDPSTAGVSIDATTGDFSGSAWGENVGWITFASTGAHPFKVETTWSCDPVPAVPSGSPALSLERSGGAALLSWTAPADATGFDVISGDLGTLRSSGGDFSQGTVTEVCLDNNDTTGSFSSSETTAPGEGSWFLVRGVNCAEGVDGLHGTYDTTGMGQTAPRDAAIDGSGNDCQ